MFGRGRGGGKAFPLTLPRPGVAEPAPLCYLPRPPQMGMATGRWGIV